MLLSVCQTVASEVGTALKSGRAESSGYIPSTALTCLEACVLLLSSALPSRCVPLDCPVPFHVSSGTYRWEPTQCFFFPGGREVLKCLGSCRWRQAPKQVFTSVCITGVSLSILTSIGCREGRLCPVTPE